MACPKKFYPYRFIRHPMYLGQVAAVIPLVHNYFIHSRPGVLLLLFMTLVFKMHYEEKGRFRQFGKACEDYRKHTKKALPFIY